MIRKHVLVLFCASVLIVSVIDIIQAQDIKTSILNEVLTAKPHATFGITTLARYYPHGRRSHDHESQSESQPDPEPQPSPSELPGCSIGCDKNDCSVSCSAGQTPSCACTQCDYGMAGTTCGSCSCN